MKTGSNFQTVHNINQDYSIEDLGISENLSVRSMNVCRQQGLVNLSEIIKYYQKEETFLNIKNAGTKTNDELV